MNSEWFWSNKTYIIVAVTNDYSIETYSASSDKGLDLMREDLTEENGYRSYVIYKLNGDEYSDIERWTARKGKEVKNEN